MKEKSMSNLQVLAKKVRELRKQHGMTQIELADIAGVSLPSITRFEKGKETIRLDVLTKILNSLGYELAIKPIQDGTWTK